MSGSERHRKLKNAIRKALGPWRDVACFNNESGVAKTNGRYVRYGLGEGGADLICLVYPGRWVELEIKTGKARLQRNQKARKRLVERLGGAYYVVRSLEEAIEAIEYETRKNREDAMGEGSVGCSRRGHESADGE